MIAGRREGGTLRKQEKWDEGGYPGRRKDGKVGMIREGREGR